MPGSLERLTWIARWKLAALFNRNCFRAYPIRDYRIHLNISESLMAWQCARGEYDAAKLRLLEETLEPGTCFVDAGANLGYFSLFAASLVGRGGLVLAVEPEPGNIHWLKSSVEASGFDQVHVIESALSDRPGKAVLHLGKKSGWHTLNPGQRNREVGELEVKTHTLDELVDHLDRVDCIKIDVEGHEFALLTGAKDTLRQHRPVILLDTHPQLGAPLGKMEALLRTLDYCWCRLDTPDRRLEQMPAEPAELLLKPE